MAGWVGGDGLGLGGGGAGGCGLGGGGGGGEGGGGLGGRGLGGGGGGGLGGGLKSPTGMLGQHAMSEDMSVVTVSAPGKRASGVEMACRVGHLPRNVMQSSAPAEPMFLRVMPKLVTLRLRASMGALVGR